jgi:hypothetical protein
MVAKASRNNRYDVLCRACGTDEEPYKVADYLPGPATVQFKQMHDQTFHSGRETCFHLTYTLYDVICEECSTVSLNDDPVDANVASKMRDDHNALYHADGGDP